TPSSVAAAADPVIADKAIAALSARTCNFTSRLPSRTGPHGSSNASAGKFRRRICEAAGMLGGNEESGGDFCPVADGKRGTPDQVGTHLERARDIQRGGAKSKPGGILDAHTAIQLRIRTDETEQNDASAGFAVYRLDRIVVRVVLGARPRRPKVPH